MLEFTLKNVNTDDRLSAIAIYPNHGTPEPTLNILRKIKTDELLSAIALFWPRLSVLAQPNPFNLPSPM
jgi:hypothetical protein